MTPTRLLLLGFTLSGVIGCAQFQLQSESTPETPEDTTADVKLWADFLDAPDAISAAVPPAISEQASPYPDDLWARVRAGFAMDGVDHERTAAELAYYKRHPVFLDRVSERATPYLYHIVSEVEARGMPMEIALLPVVESAFQPFAYSHGRAAGIWQFIPGTGRHFGLKQTWWYDGRRDIIASTEAALTYLERLNNMFDGDWQLALAAYNAGEGTVMRAIRRNQAEGLPTDYWSLRLPQETRQYVPRLLAIRELVDAPDEHGMAMRSIPNQPYLEVVEVGSQIDLALAADLADLTIDELYLLNPGFNRWATDPEGPHRLVVPIDNAEVFAGNLESIPPAERVQWARHRVEPGQTLGQIARRYNTTVSVLQETNNINGHVIRAGSHLIVPTSSRPSQQYALSADQRLTRNQNRSRNGNRVEHRVQRGDTFWGLSRRYGVGVRQIAQWNNMAPADTLRPGQTLVIWASDSNGRQAGNNGPAQGQPIVQRVRYTVRQGDSLYRIAQRFRVSVDDLRAWNNLSGQRYLQPGQQLTLHVDVRNQSGS